MKKSILLLLLFTSVLNAKSQLIKGNWLVGGSGSLYSYNGTYISSSYNSESKYTDIEVSASIGYFVSDKFTFGLRPTFSSRKGEVGGGTTNVKRYAIGPFGRFYLLNVDKQFNILSDLSYQTGINDWHGQSGKINTFTFMAGPVIYFNTSVGLEILLGYSSRKENIKGLYKDSRKGLQVGVGFQFYLEK